MSIRIKDVARLAGVSAATVSRVFTNGPVSADLKKKVEAAVKATGYRPNLSARRLRSQHSEHHRADRLRHPQSVLHHPQPGGRGRRLSRRHAGRAVQHRREPGARGDVSAPDAGRANHRRHLCADAHDGGEARRDGLRFPRRAGRSRRAVGVAGRRRNRQRRSRRAAGRSSRRPGPSPHRRAVRQHLLDRRSSATTAMRRRWRGTGWRPTPASFRRRRRPRKPS